MKDISILIPTYNDRCDKLVGDLQRQAALTGIDYEIIVGDDGSTDSTVLVANREGCRLPCCRLIERRENCGRSAIRNFLVSQARYEWVLFIDSDMVVCREDFVQRYAESDAPVVYGGVVIGSLVSGNLRSMYEKSAEHEHTVEHRRQTPYQDFHTANFMVRRDIMTAHPFDDRFRHYGYEDVLLGKALQQEGIAIAHIDNPLSFEIYESNADFVKKTEEGLRTLYHFRKELRGYSRLITVADKIPHTPIRWWHRCFKTLERGNLVGPRPNLLLFKLYKLGYYLSLFRTDGKA